MRRSKSVSSAPIACSRIGNVQDDQAYKKKRRCQTRSPTGHRSPQASRSGLPPLATTKKGRAAAIVASAAVRGGGQRMPAGQEAEAPLHGIPGKSFADLASTTEPPLALPLKCEEEASPKALPPTVMLIPEAEEKREAAKEPKEKRKKRREAGSKGDVSDRASDGGSARCPLVGAQVMAGASERGGARESVQACHLLDGTGTGTLETCGTATSEGLSSIRRPQSPVSVAEEPSGCESVEAIVWEQPKDHSLKVAEQPEDDASKIGEEPRGDVPNVFEPPHDDEHKLIEQAEVSEQCSDREEPSELSSRVSEEMAMSWGAASDESPSPDATSTSGQAPVVFDLATDSCAIFYDLAMADRETPALAAEFTAELSKVDLEHFAEPLARLGVEAARDVAYLSDKELVRMGMRLVQRRKLRALSASADGEEDEALAEDGEESAKAKAESGTDGCSSEVSTASLDFERSPSDVNTLEAHAVGDTDR